MCRLLCIGMTQGTHFVAFDDGDKVDLTLAEEAWRRVWLSLCYLTCPLERLGPAYRLPAPVSCC